MKPCSAQTCGPRCRWRTRLAEKRKARLPCGDAVGARDGSWCGSFPCRATMRVAFFGRFVRAAEPPPEEQRPKRNRAGNDEQPKSPTSVRRVRVNLFHANQSEWERKHQSASQISSKQKQKYNSDHGAVGVG